MNSVDIRQIIVQTECNINITHGPPLRCPFFLFSAIVVPMNRIQNDTYINNIATKVSLRSKNRKINSMTIVVRV